MYVEKKTATQWDLRQHAVFVWMLRSKEAKHGYTFVWLLFSFHRKWAFQCRISCDCAEYFQWDQIKAQCITNEVLMHTKPNFDWNEGCSFWDSVTRSATSWSEQRKSLWFGSGLRFGSGSVLAPWDAMWAPAQTLSDVRSALSLFDPSGTGTLLEFSPVANSLCSFDRCVCVRAAVPGLCGCERGASVSAGGTVVRHGRERCQGTAGSVRMGSCWTSCVNVAHLADGHASAAAAAAAAGHCTSHTHTHFTWHCRRKPGVSPWAKSVYVWGCVRVIELSLWLVHG